MIKYDGGVEFHGTKIDLVTELTLIMKRMVEKGVLDRNEVNLVVETVFTPIGEIHKQVEESVKSMSDFDKFMMRMMTGIDADEVASHSVPTDN